MGNLRTPDVNSPYSLDVIQKKCCGSSKNPAGTVMDLSRLYFAPHNKLFDGKTSPRYDNFPFNFVDSLL